MRKYELTDETKTYFGRTLHRIKAIVDFCCIKAGEIGGWIETEDNLSQYGDSWVYCNAQVYGNAWVYGDARVSGDAQVAAKECIFWIGAIGSRNGTTTFFNCKDGKIRVSCGCFYGDLDEFAKAVNKTHGDNEHGQVYRLAIEMAKKRIHTVCHEVKRNDQD